MTWRTFIRDRRLRSPHPIAKESPLRLLWYWPHPSSGDSDFAAAVLEPGDTLTVQCLERLRGEQLTAGSRRYEVRRDLPDVSRASLGSVRRLLDRVIVHGRRAWRRDRLVRSGQFDLVHIQTSTVLDALSIGRLVSRLPVVVVVHDVRPHNSRLPAPIERRLLGRIYRSATYLVVYHESVRSRLLAEFPMPAERVRVIPLPLTAGPTRGSDSVGDAHGEHSGPATVLFFGSFRPDKGLDILIRALEQVPAGLIDVTIAGEGDDHLEQLVRSAAHRLPHVRAEVGYVTPERREELYQGTDLVVLPYWAEFESQSAVLLDAYGHGLPLVVTDVGAIGPTIRHDGSGWVVPAGDVDALAVALMEAASDGTARARAASGTRAAARDHEPTTVARALRSVYRDAITTAVDVS
jgi:glycosyltransferase involved in cell wall biosynthesis